MKHSVLFSLIRDNSGSMKGHSGNKAFILEGCMEIVDPRPNKSGTCFIRYIPSEKSIFVDQQTTDFDWNKIQSGEHKVNDIHFNDGSRLCDMNQVRLIEYLRAAKSNTTNAVINRYYGSTYEEANSKEKSNDTAMSWEAETKLRKQLVEMPEVKLKAIYRVMSNGNINQINEMEVSSIRHNLNVLANKDKAMFDILYSDKLLGVKYDLYEALDKGIVSQHPSDMSMLMMNDRMVKTAPSGTNPIQFFAEWLNMDGQDTLELIRKRIGREKSSTPDIATPEQDAARLIEFMKTNERGEELFVSKSPSARAFVYEDGNEVALGNSNKLWIKTLVEDEDLRKAAMDRYQKLKG